MLAKGSLESAGIECFLADENLVRLDWFISNFIGGIKLNVRVADVENARKILDDHIRRAMPRRRADKVFTARLVKFLAPPSGLKLSFSAKDLSALTGLSLNYCGIGSAGMDALIRSPHLRNLVSLGAAGNELTRPAGLFPPARLPRLKALRLQHNRIKPATIAKLRAARDWSVEDADA